jgi:hypothetical protein
MKPRCLIYSNCIGLELSRLFNMVPAFASRFQTVFVRNWAVEKGFEAKDPEPFKDCRILIYQIRHWEDEPDFFAALPEKCVRLSFPTLTMHPLWPLQCQDPRNHPEPEAGCHNGRFPFGDSLALSLINKGLSPEEAYQEYLKTDLLKVVKLHRLKEVAFAKMRQLDTKVDIRMAPFVEEHFTTHRLFRNVMYPTAEMQIFLGNLILRAFGLGGVSLSIKRHFLETAPTWDYDVPIHPQVIEYWKIPWAGIDTRYHYLKGRTVTFHEYLMNYLRFEV